MMLRNGSALMVAIALVAGCGGGTPPGQTGLSATTSAVEIHGRAMQRGSRASVLVFAYADLAATDDPMAREPASVGIVADDGTFDLAVPDGGTLALVFLADGANDGVIDRGDATAVLTAPELADLQPGDRVQIADAAIDFTNRRVTASIEVARAAEAPRTPTPLPAGA